MDQLYKRYAPMVYRRCLRLMGAPERAEEAMQDVFVKVMDKRQSLDLTAPSSLLYRMATNVCLNLLRGQTRRPEVHEDDLLHEIAECEWEEEKRLRFLFMRSALQNEKDETRAMAVLHYVDRMTLDEVAEEYGMSVSGVRKRLETFKARIRALEGETS